MRLLVLTLNLNHGATIDGFEVLTEVVKNERIVYLPTVYAFWKIQYIIVEAFCN